MGTFPVQYSEATLSGRTPNARANLDMNTNADMIGKAVSNIGALAGNIYTDIRAKEDASELSTLDRKIQENWNAEYKSLQETQDAEARAQIHQKAAQDRIAIANSSKRANVNASLNKNINNYEPQFDSHFNNLDKNMRLGKAKDDLDLNIASAINRGDYKAAEKAVGLAIGTGLINDSEGELKLLNAKTTIGINNVQNEVAKLKGEGKFDEAVQLVQSQPETIIDAEKAQAMIANIESYREYTKRRTVDMANEREVSAYDNLTDAFISGEIKPDDIESSLLPDTENNNKKNIFRAYINGKNSGTVPESTYKGNSNISDAVLDYSLNKSNKQQAYDTIMTERYINNSITDAEFNDAMKRIKKTYPATVIHNLDAVYTNNKNNFNRWFSFDNDINKEVNNNLFTWVDAKLEKGEVPTRKEMDDVSADFRVSARDRQEGKEKTKSLYKTGDTRTVNGKTYTFDGTVWKR